MKKVSAKIGTYQDKSGNTKGRYVELGMIGTSQHGEYLVLHPHIDLAGIALTQQANGMGREGKVGIMCSIWDQDQSNDSGGNSDSAPSADIEDKDLPF